jgi:hypothetical protein
MHATESIAPRQRNPRSKPARAIRLWSKPQGASAGVVRITSGKAQEDYLLTELDAEFGRGFKVEKIGFDCQGSAYAVNVNGVEKHCECKGFTRTASRRSSPQVACSNTDRGRVPSPPPAQEGKSMLLRHATLARNLPSIIKCGLLTSKSKGKLPVVWICCRAKTAWAALHVVKRHGGRVESVVILEFDVPRSWLRRSKKGLWYCPRDIPSDRIQGVVTFGALARSPIGEATAD